jgi:hypothetical protein
MAIKWKSLDLNMKLELICLCEAASLAESEIQRCTELTSALCVILKKIKQYALKPSKGSFSLHKS